LVVFLVKCLADLFIIIFCSVLSIVLNSIFGLENFLLLANFYDIKEIRKGQNTETFANYGKIAEYEERAFSIIYPSSGKIKTLDLGKWPPHTSIIFFVVLLFFLHLLTYRKNNILFISPL